MLLLTQYVAKHEFKPLSRFLTLDDLLDGAKFDRILEDVQQKRYQEFPIEIIK